MNFNHEEMVEGGGKAQPGEYRFMVDEFDEVTFRTGSQGAKAKLLVAVGDRDITCYVNFSYSPKALWRMRDFMAAIGLDFSRSASVQPHNFLRRQGRAVFVAGEKGYLEPEQYIPASANNAPGAARPSSQPADEMPNWDAPPPSDDDVPF